MTRCGRLLRELCGHCEPRNRTTQDRKTDDLIDEAERTRRELNRITVRLAEHVGALHALARAYARKDQEEPGRG